MAQDVTAFAYARFIWPSERRERDGGLVCSYKGGSPLTFRSVLLLRINNLIKTLRRRADRARVCKSIRQRRAKARRLRPIESPFTVQFRRDGNLSGDEPMPPM